MGPGVRVDTNRLRVTEEEAASEAAANAAADAASA
jgi:hypothetical protein